MLWVKNTEAYEYPPLEEKHRTFRQMPAERIYRELLWKSKIMKVRYYPCQLKKQDTIALKFIDENGIVLFPVI